jgi:hypothetical protein
MWGMRIVTSREYKLMLDQRWFADRKPAIAQFWGELQEFLGSLNVDAAGEFSAERQRTIWFLDTPDETIRQNGLLLRRRVLRDGSGAEYTLKCRSADRYIAAGSEFEAAPGYESEEKFEEDIAFPFASRFSHSLSIAVPEEAFERLPQRLSEVSALFPRLAELTRDNRPCDGETLLAPVNGLEACERVLTGPEVRLAGRKKPVKAKVALILWSSGWHGRPLTAEFSFRYKDEDEGFTCQTAQVAKRLFEHLPRFDWFRPDGMTKTQYVYRARVDRGS